MVVVVHRKFLAARLYIGLRCFRWGNRVMLLYPTEVGENSKAWSAFIETIDSPVQQSWYLLSVFSVSLHSETYITTSWKIYVYTIG
jgi:hypothetical protein